MDLSHRNAFELLQRSIDGRLDADEQAELERHMAICAECQADAALYRRLEKEAQAYRPAVVPSQEDVQQTIQKTRAHHRRWRMFKRLSSPVRTAAWAAAAVALVLGVIWIFNTVTWDSQTGTPEVTRIFETVVEQVEVTRVVKETVIEKVEVTPVFDAEAEEEAVMSAVQAMFDAFAVPDAEAMITFFHKDYEDFSVWPEEQYRQTFQDFDPDKVVSTIVRWDDYSVIVTPDLAVIKGILTHTTDYTGSNQFYQTYVLIKEDGEWKFIHGHGSHAW